MLMRAETLGSGVLVLADHDNKTLNASTLSAVTAAQKFGECVWCSARLSHFFSACDARTLGKGYRPDQDVLGESGEVTVLVAGDKCDAVAEAASKVRRWHCCLALYIPRRAAGSTLP